MADLIPGLHNHGAYQFLYRLPYDKLKKLKKVSPEWKAEIERPGFHSTRRSLGLTQPVIVVVQRWEDPSWKKFYPNHYDATIFRLALFRKDTGRWSYLKHIPKYPKSFPPYCTVVGVGMELVVLGGLDPNNYEKQLDSVFIYNFLSRRWRCGARMPDQGQIMHFGCCSDFENTIYLVGGSDENHVKSKSVMAYDMAQDNWTRLPDMAKARVECQVAFHQGKLHVIHEYSLCYGGPAKMDIDILDVRRMCWDSMVTENGFGRGIYADGIEKGMYKCCMQSRKIFKREGAAWSVVTDVPEKVELVYYSTMWGNKLLVICSVELDHVECLTVDLETLMWRKLDMVPPSYTQSIMSGCYLEI